MGLIHENIHRDKLTCLYNEQPLFKIKLDNLQSACNILISFRPVDDFGSSDKEKGLKENRG